ncbi:MAG: sporulation protein YunB [bacterium]
MKNIFWIIKNKVFIILILFIIVSTILVRGYFSDAVKEYVKYDCSNKINEMIISTINNEIVNELTTESLLNVSYNENKEVSYAYINTQKTNEILGLTGTAINNLNEEFNNNGKNKIDIPLGYIFSQNVFFANGITVPVNVSNISKYNVKLETNVEEYGINASLITVSLVYEFSFKAMIPLITDDVFITNSVPLVTTVLYGDVPEYFFSGEKPNISVS